MDSVEILTSLDGFESYRGINPITGDFLPVVNLPTCEFMNNCLSIYGHVSILAFYTVQLSLAVIVSYYSSLGGYKVNKIVESTFNMINEAMEVNNEK